jgi:hypothetical protein
MGRASKTDPPLTAGAQAPAAPTLPPDGAALPPALAGRLAASAERAGEAPDAHLERLLGPALDAEEERHPSKTQIRIARGIGIVLAALALLTVPYVVQTGDLFKGLVIWFATVGPAIILIAWPAFGIAEAYNSGSRYNWSGDHPNDAMFSDVSRNSDWTPAGTFPGGTDTFSQSFFGPYRHDDRD